MVVLVIWAVLLLVASQSTLWDRDESRYATAALEMHQSGNMLYPTFNHELRAYQPIMVYWLMSAGIHILGPTELAVRLASTMAMAGVCFLTGLIARKFLGSGAMAAVIAGTSPLLLLSGTAATTDASLLFCIMFAEWIFIRAWLDGPRRWHIPGLGAAMGLAMLIKGPVGLAVPALSIGAALALARKRSAAGPFFGKLAIASLIALAIFLAWGLPANAATDGEYWHIAIVERLPKRLFTAMENHGGQGLLPFLLHLPYYPLVLIIGFLPWTMYLILAPGAFRKNGFEKNWSQSPEGFRALLLGMIVPTFVLMTLIVSKLPHYLLPVFPWFAILTAAALDSAKSREDNRRIRLSFLFFVIPALLAAAALIVQPPFPPALARFRGFSTAAGIFIVVLAGVLAWKFQRGRIRDAAKIHVIAMMTAVLGCAFFLFPLLEKSVKPAQTLAREIRSKIPPGASLATYGWREPGMHFYLNARRINYLHNQSSLDEWLSSPGSKILIANETEAPFPTPDGFQLLGRQEGLNPVHGRNLRLAAYGKN